MSKGLIIGLASLGIGLAIAGGVGGYFINDAISKKNVQIPNITTDDEGTIYELKDYNFPEEFNYVSHTVYDIGDKFALFSSSTIGSYVLNKETKSFKFFNSSNVSSHSEIVNGYKYFWLSNNNLFKFNIETGEYEIVSMNSGVAFSSLTFIGNTETHMFMKGYNSSAVSGTSYYVVDFDTEKGQSEVYSITSSESYNIDSCIDLGDYLWTTKVYANLSSSSTASSYIFNKKSKEKHTLESSMLYREGNYIIKDKKLYAQLKRSSTTEICSVDLTSGEISTIQTLTYTGGTIFQLKKGFLYCYYMNVNSSSYSSTTAYYVSFEDDSATQIQTGSSSSYCIAYVVNDKILISPSSSSSGSKNGTLATFDEDSKTLTTIFTALVTSSSSYQCNIYRFEDRYYVSADGSNFALMQIEANGEFSFKNINLKVRPTADSVKLAENKYLYISDGIKYYDFETDMYKSLASSSSLKVKDVQVNGNIAIIYASNHIKYEFNMESLSFKTIAYWEETEID